MKVLLKKNEKKADSTIKCCQLFKIKYFFLERVYALARASKMATAGNFLPSKNSRKAPPPVEI
jgi:hypothetical protein